MHTEKSISYHIVAAWCNLWSLATSRPPDAVLTRQTDPKGMQGTEAYGFYISFDLSNNQLFRVGVACTARIAGQMWLSIYKDLLEAMDYRWAYFHPS